MGKGKRRESLLSFPFPSLPARFLFLSPQPPYDTKRPLWRRETRYRKFRIREMKKDKYAKQHAKNQVCAIFRMQDTRKNVLPKFIKLCVKTPCWCPFEELKYGGRKPTETSVFQFLYKSENLSFEELIKEKVKIQKRKFRIREMKEDKYAQRLAKNQVCAIFHMRDTQICKASYEDVMKHLCSSFFYKSENSPLEELIKEKAIFILKQTECLKYQKQWVTFFTYMRAFPATTTSGKSLENSTVLYRKTKNPFEMKISRNRDVVVR